MARSIPTLTLVFSFCWSIFCLVSAQATDSPSSRVPKQEINDKDLLAASNRDTILVFVIVVLVIAIVGIIVWYLTKKPALEPKEQCLLDSDSNPNYGTMIDVLTTQIFVASDLSRVTVSLNPRQPLRILHEKTLTVSFVVDQTVSNSARKLLGSGDLVPSSLVAPYSEQNFAMVRIWRDKHERFTGVLFQTSQPRQVASALLYASPVAVVAIGNPSAVVEYRRSGHNTTISVMIFIHYLTAPIKSTSDPLVETVKRVIALPGAVALMHRVSGRFVPIIKSDFETHVFLCPATEPSNTHNEDTLAVVVELITEALPRTDVNLGACIAAAMTEAADGNATLSFNTDGSFTAVAHNTTGVDMRSGSTRPTDRVGWRLLVESDWSHTSSTETTEPASQAYVLEFKMDGLNDAAAEAEVRRQLAWGEGIKLERRGRSVSEEVTVNVRGPNGQRLRALTSLQEHNVGESGAPVVVRVSVDGVVRVQFWPGQIDDQ